MPVYSPRHVAVIMDGNRRWARSQGLPLTLGYEAGVTAALKMVEVCVAAGIQHLTLYALSTENFATRSPLELNTIFTALQGQLGAYSIKLCSLSARITFIGDTTKLPPGAKRVLLELADTTAHNNAITVRVALNYGGRQEIVRAAQKISHAVLTGDIAVDKIDAELFASYLYDQNTPDPDLILRTGCVDRARISNFMLWQMAYSELFFSRTMWPAYTAEEFLGVIDEFKSRSRSFGG